MNQIVYVLLNRSVVFELSLSGREDAEPYSGPETVIKKVLCFSNYLRQRKKER